MAVHVSTAQAKNLDTFSSPLILCHSISNSSRNPDGFTLKIYPQSDLLLTPHWYHPGPSTWPFAWLTIIPSNRFPCLNLSLPHTHSSTQRDGNFCNTWGGAEYMTTKYASLACELFCCNWWDISLNCPTCCWVSYLWGSHTYEIKMFSC